MKYLRCLLIFLILTSFNLKGGIDDGCGTTSSTSAPHIPTNGNLKILVVFAQFKDDPQSSNSGWDLNSFPSWANSFVNSTANSSYPWNNLSHYYNEMSNGDFQVIGDVYGSLVTTDHDESYYSDIGQVNREILLEIDPFVDFSDYDNLDGNSSGSDGEVDFVMIIYRNIESNIFPYTGIAKMDLSSNISADGVTISDHSYIGGGVQQKSGYHGRVICTPKVRH